MRALIDRYLQPLREGEGGGAGGGAGDTNAAGGAGATASAGAAGDTPPAGGGESASPGQPPAGPEGPYRIDGLDDGLFGTNDRETIDKMAARIGEMNASRATPDDPAAYADFSAVTLPDGIKDHVTGLAGLPTFEAATKAAKEHGVPVAAFQAITTAMFEAADASGLLEPPLDINAEKAALLPAGLANAPKAAQDAAIDARLNAVVGLVDLAVQNKEFGKDIGDHAKLMIDSAKGVQFLEWALGKAGGAGRAQPGAQGDTAGSPSKEARRAELRAKIGAADMQPGHPNYSREKRQALDDEYRREYGSE